MLGPCLDAGAVSCLDAGAVFRCCLDAGVLDAGAMFRCWGRV